MSFDELIGTVYYIILGLGRIILSLVMAIIKVAIIFLLVLAVSMLILTLCQDSTFLIIGRQTQDGQITE